MFDNLIIFTLSLPRFLKRIIVLVLDIVLCIFATSIAFYLRIGEWIPFFTQSNWSPIYAAQISIITAVPIFIALGLYREIFRYSGWLAILTLIRAMIIYSVLYVLFISIIGINGVPRTLGLIQPIVLLILIGGSRGLASYWLSNAYRQQLKLANLPRVLIYGAGNAGRQLAGALSHSYDMVVVGFLDDDKEKQGQNLLGYRVYRPDRLISVVERLKVDVVLLAIPSANRHRRNQILKTIENARVSIQTLPSMSDLAQGKISTQDLRPLGIDDLLSRELVLPDSDLLSKNSYQKIILVTGAGGSIGSELCRQILGQFPKKLVLIDQSEYALYQINQELNSKLASLNIGPIEVIPILVSVTNQKQIRKILKQYQPHVVYHTAAYKHVPLVESNPVEGVRNNVMGTLILARLCEELEIPNFTLISTDKAVRPTNVMGASKRIAEMILQALASNNSKTCFSMVRFGNVLNSSGSVVPKFWQQIKNGGPITITDLRVTRFFMTIPEAAQLVIQAGAMAKGGDVFLLDMGDPIRIVDLAKRMINLSGLEVRDVENPNGDIEIQEIGLRPGEKLYEELLIEGSINSTDHPRIFKANEGHIPWNILVNKLSGIESAIECDDQHLLNKIMQEIVVGYITESIN